MEQPRSPPANAGRAGVWKRIVAGILGSVTLPALVGILLSVAFILTNLLGDVTDSDINAFYTIYEPGQITDAQLSPLASLNQTGQFKIIAECHVNDFQISELSPNDIYLTNWFGEQMRIVLHITETIIGFFYDIHLPTSVQAVAQLVRDQKFGTHEVKLLMGTIPRDTVSQATAEAVSQKQCNDVVVEELRLGNYVCEIDRIYLDKASNKLIGSHVYRLCLTPLNATVAIIPPRPIYSLRTRVKLFLGFLTEKIDSHI